MLLLTITIDVVPDDRLEEAVTACNLALEANEHNTKARLRRADANYSLGGEDRLAQALRDYEVLQESREEGSPDMSSKIKQVRHVPYDSHACFS
jgi:hypothetical protein